MKQQPRFGAVGWIATRIHREEEMVDARSDPPFYEAVKVNPLVNQVFVNR
uniref:Uncharacterized protein n=1 Tax=Candidatus Kentrum sp. LPFa TaxID=2126335 RepID=A0A450WAF0_9GAMM|nr:MAG: hypothetical protein BECKLPF1236A_GA0070988_100986 [Candidatus Kentron sp. LPFa]